MSDNKQPEVKVYKGLVLNDYENAAYAQWVKEGVKTIETRMNRLFSYRGDVVICCGKSNSVGQNSGNALCIVEIWKGRDMLKTDEAAACIEWHPKRKSLLLRNWRHFEYEFKWLPYAIQKNYQGMFDMRLPEGIEILPMPYEPYKEIELDLFTLKS